jgi:hypothetical protein
MELSGTESDGLNEIPVAGSTTTSSVPTAAAKQTHAHMTTAQIAIAVQEPKTLNILVIFTNAPAASTSAERLGVGTREDLVVSRM